jgi:DNA gyrase subunit A
MFVVNNHDYLLLFTEMGRCFWIRGYEIPEGSKTGTGRVMQNLIRMPKEDKVKAYIRIKDLTDEEYINNNYIIFCTRKGVIKKTLVEQFSRIRTNGINAITINEGDMLMEVKLTNGENEIVIANRNGRAIRFPEAKVRSMGRSAAGVRGIKLDNENDFAVGMLSVKEDSQKTIFVVSENGFGKRSEIGEYRTTNRGGKGVKTMSVTEKTGKVAAIKAVSEFDDMMITTKDGIMIRLAVTDVRIMGRAAQGVKCINLGKKSSISDVAVIRRTEEEKRAEEEE